MTTSELMRSALSPEPAARAHFLSFPKQGEAPAAVAEFARMHALTQAPYLREHNLSPWTTAEFHKKLMGYGNAVALKYPDAQTPYDYFQMHTEPVTVFDQQHIRLGTFGFSESAMQTGKKAASIEHAGNVLGETHRDSALWIEVCGKPTKFEKVLLQSGFSPSPYPDLVENLLEASGVDTLRVWQDQGVTYHETPSKEYPQKVLIFDRSARR